MQRTPPFPFLPDLQMPLRDAMRGVATFAEATEEALEPAVKLLPEPLRQGFERGVKSIEETGKRLVDLAVKHEHILSAAQFATGQAGATSAARDFAKVTSFAWEHLQQATDGPRFMISETILASRGAPQATEETGAVHGAALVKGIRQSTAIGRMPGIADGIGTEDRNHIDLLLAAIMVWLLAARAETLEEELTLLDLAMALVSAIKTDIIAAMDDQNRLADILDASSAHL